MGMFMGRFVSSVKWCVVLALASASVAQAQSGASGPASTVKSGNVTPAGYKGSPGPYEPGEVATLSIKDDARGKMLSVKVRYPKAMRAESGKLGAPIDASARFPLVVFSHGMGGDSGAFPELTAHWASHGYVVVLPTHSDSIRQRRENGEEVKNPRVDPKGALRTVDPQDRLADVRLILDSIDSIEASAPELRVKGKDGAGVGRIDRDKLAIAGHSAGAFTAELAIGVRARGKRVTGQRGIALTSVAEPRLKAAIFVSGQGTTNLAFTDDSWSKLDRPTLVIAGSKDVSGVSNETPESRREPFERSRGRAKGGPASYLLYIEGATHGSYQGKMLVRTLGEKPETPVETIGRATMASTLAFLDAWVKDDPKAKAVLESDAIKRIEPAKIEWQWK